MGTQEEEKQRQYKYYDQEVLEQGRRNVENPIWFSGAMSDRSIHGHKEKPISDDWANGEELARD